MRKNEIRKLKESVGIRYPADKYSKSELRRIQGRLNTLMSYALYTENSDLMENCHELAGEYRSEKGYGQETTEFSLEERQNNDRSVKGVIKKLREEVGA